MSDRPPKVKRNGKMSAHPTDKNPQAPKSRSQSAKGLNRTDEDLVDYYNDLLKEPIPDRFKDLLKQLEAKEKK